MMEELQALLDGLNDDEQAVVLAVAIESARKMLHGAKKYGHWSPATDTRDWEEEARQESIDRRNYEEMARRQRAVRR